MRSIAAAALVGLCFACSQGVLQSSSTKAQSDKDDSKRPSEQPEGLLGYLTSPDAVYFHAASKEVRGDAGAVQRYDELSKAEIEVCVLALAKADFGAGKFVLLARSLVRADGSFAVGVSDAQLKGAEILAVDVGGSCDRARSLAGFSSQSMAYMDTADPKLRFDSYAGVLGALRQKNGADATPVVERNGGDALVMEPASVSARAGAKPAAPGADDSNLAWPYPLYANTRDTLYGFDPSTGKVQTIARFALADGRNIEVEDIAIAADGTMRAVSSAGLFTVDPKTFVLVPAPTTPKSPDSYVGLKCYTGIVMTGYPCLFERGFDTPSGLDTPATADISKDDTPTTVVTGDSTASPSGVIYANTVGAGSDVLLRFDAATKAQQTVGPIPQADIRGLGYAATSLYGFAAQGRIVEIAPATGAVIRTFPAGGAQDWVGATGNPTRREWR